MRRQLRRLMTSVNEEHVHPKLGYRTSGQYRHTKRLRTLPADVCVDGPPFPIAAGKVSVMRLVSAQGTINILGQQYRISTRLTFEYIKATLFTARQTVQVYHRGRLLKAFPYTLTVK